MFTHYELMKPLMHIMQNKRGPISNQEALNQVIQYLGLTEEQKNLKMENGKNLIQYRLRWAKTYLKKAGLIETIDNQNFQLTSIGNELNLNSIQKFSNKILSTYPSFREFRAKNKELAQESTGSEEEQTPEEIIEIASKELNQSLKEELLEKIKANSPKFFEQLVVDLLVAMGYGGSHQDAAQAIGKTNDGGIDGVISEDRLGLDKIYIQAKRWENTVGRPDIQQFKGALADQVAKKGVFITTSNFSKEAIESAKKSGIVLIDGDKLTTLMIEFGLGVQIERSFHIYKIDQDRFDEDNF
ncbi:restriction endonuclease [Acinetobacter sp. HR7]|uniref:restriction endonuclease n=1 Tax=Acinetobacter sp. HR7 TaxID=1509403 RepID=UPI0009D68E61